MKKVLLCIVLVFSALYSKAQDMPEIVPPSPEASALAQFTDVPVSHYTGLPNISVPIYTIQQKGIQIPISLSYHARGVMVSETAPRTGTGWSLQYGGSVSRQVRGKGDESPNNGYLANRNRFMTYSTDADTRSAVDGNEVADPGYDFYPDQFSFNAGGTSGKFILNYVDGQPVIQSFGDVKISYTIGPGQGFNSIDSFIITDSGGNKYYFGISKDGYRKAQDYQNSVGMSVFFSGNVETDGNSNSDNRVFSAWKLMDVENSYGELISYFYETSGGSTYYRKAFDKSAPSPPSSDNQSYGGGFNPTTDPNNPFLNNSTSSPNSLENINNIERIYTRISRVTNYEKHLSKIEFNNGRDSIKFLKSQNSRLDFEGKALGKIAVYNEDNIVKSYQLNYSNTTSVDRTNMLSFIPFGTYGNNPHRMFLASVEEEASDGQKLPPYIFTYDSQVLPSMYSSSQDYWGYYNGAENNGPFTRLFEYGNYVPNRRVNISKSEAGILKEIKYPTGGKSRFTYEHNVGMAPDYFNTIVVPSINPSSENEVETILTKEDFTYVNGSYQPINIDIPASTRVSYRFNCITPLSNINNPPPADCVFDFRLNSYPVNTTATFFGYTSNENNHSGSISLGVYPSDPYTNGNLHLDDAYDFQITVKYHTPDYQYNLYGAGKRIKKVEHFNENGMVTTKEYDYVYPSEAGFGSASSTPSGGIIGFPAFINTTTHPNDSQYANMTKYYDATSAYSSFQANSIGYGGVIEYHGTKDKNIGKIEYTFTSIADSGGDYWEFPYHPPTDNEWLRGKPIRTRVFKRKENGDYKLAKESHNKYLYGDVEYTPDFELPGFRHLDFMFTPEGTDHNWYTNVPFEYENNRTFFKLPLFMKKRLPMSGNIDVQNWEYRIYHLTGGTLNLKRTTTKDYYDDGNTQEIITENFFDYNKHYQQKSTKITDSKGDVIESKNYYPTDATLVYPNYTSDIALAQQVSHLGKLKGANRFEVVLTESYKNDTLQSKLRTTYLDKNKIILPKSVQTSKGTNDLKERIVYHSYDDDKNMREVSKKDGTHIVYIWGYNRTLPVAKIEGATFNEVQSYVANIEATSNSDDDRTVDSVSGTNRVFVGKEGALRNALQVLRNALPNAQVTSFTYDPLIGATSITDPRGRTLYYQYDSFNRLEIVKDHDGNTVSKTEYNYKN